MDNIFMQNRELSWLKFNERVLEKGKLESLPLYERLKFNSIFESNLTEFFMVRVGSLTDIAMLKEGTIDNKTGMSAQEQLTAIFEELLPLYKMRDDIYSELEVQLRKVGIGNLKYSELNIEEKNLADKYYMDAIKPMMSPNVVYKMHPFPFMENNLLYIVSELLDDDGKNCYMLLPLRTNIPDLKKIPNSSNYIMMEELILNHIEDMVPNYKVMEKHVVRVTRNADINLEQSEDDEDEDYRRYVKKILKNRRRLAPVRLETDSEFSPKLKKFMLKNLELDENRIFVTRAPIDMSYVWKLPSLLGNDIFTKISHERYKPRLTRLLDHSKPLIPQIEHHDVFMSYPYESMDSFIKLLREASMDPRVFSIKITIYRLASNSQLVKYLLRAADEGKEVTAIMELRARFDESNNIDYSEDLINGGVNVMYGIERFKVHSKVCLISYRDDGRTKYITHIGTGNYNESTAKLYQDMNIITAHEGIGKDASDFFNNLQIGKIDNTYKYLIQSPSSLRQTIMELMDVEIAKGQEGYIRLKCNSITDKDIIEKIAEASRAGVKVDIIVRGICCIIPGIEGQTENVRVRSIVGRYLEHARIYQFGKDDRMDIYIASADLMTRNTQKRVEIGVPVLDKDIQRYLVEFLDMQFRDNVNGKELKNDRLYHDIESNEQIDSHKYEMCNAPDYLVRVILEDKGDKKENKAVEDNNITGPIPTVNEEAKEKGFFKRLWEKIFG